MDAYTQRLLERTRERREMLAKKMAETDTSPKRKRNVTPLGENQTSNTRTNQDDDSPHKRPCLRVEDSMVKPDTPAIPSVKSRRQQLTVTDVEDENKSTSPVKIGSALDDRTVASPAARKNRLAALAQNINTWEDDLSHHAVKKEEKPAKKTWQPPKAPEPAAAPTKPSRTFQHEVKISPAKKSSTVNQTVSPKPYTRSVSPNKYSPVKFSPSKPATTSSSRLVSPTTRTVEEKALSSPRHEVTNVSKITVNLTPAPSNVQETIVVQAKTSSPQSKKQLSYTPAGKNQSSPHKPASVLSPTKLKDLQNASKLNHNESNNSPKRRVSPSKKIENDSCVSDTKVEGALSALLHRQTSISKLTVNLTPSPRSKKQLSYSPVERKQSTIVQMATHKPTGVLSPSKLKDTQSAPDTGVLNPSALKDSQSAPEFNLSQTYGSRRNSSPVQRRVLHSEKTAVDRLNQWKQQHEKSSPGLNETINEPTKKPVSARLAGWQQKVDEVEKSEPVFKTPSKASGVRNGVGSKALQPSAVQRLQSSVPEDDPLNMSINSRKNVWETKVQEVGADQKAITPMRPGYSTPLASRRDDMKTPSTMRSTPNMSKTPAVQSAVKTQSANRMSPTKSPGKITSPTKVAAATRSIQDRLKHMTEDSWKHNEIAEKEKSQRQKELEMLQNRWKNGVLKEEDGAVPAPTHTTPPAPPPPPPVGNASQKPAPSKEAKASVAPKKGITPHREAARDKMRQDFEHKLQAMGFDVHSTPDLGKVASVDLKPYKAKEQAQAQKTRSADKPPLRVTDVEETKVVTTTFNSAQKVTVEKKTVPANHTSSLTHTPQASRRPTPPTATPGGTSIYNLIKTGQTPRSTPAASRTATRTSPVKAISTAPRTSHDSFEDSFESSHDVESTADDKYGSQASLYSETYSETNTEDYTEDDYTEDYTETGTEDDYTEADETATTTQTEEDTYSQYSDEDDENSEINDLLDEALDSDAESEVSIPQPAPRRQKSDAMNKPRPLSTPYNQYESDYDYDQVGNRRSAPAPDKRVKFDVPSSSYMSTTTSQSSESESEPAYSLEMYRTTSKMMKNNVPAPKVTIVRHTQPRTEPQQQAEEPMPYIPEKPDRQRLQELQDLVNQEQTVIMQTSNALNQCCGQNSAFAGSQEAVECHRLLLVACKKREAYLSEINEVRAGRKVRGGPKGSLTISDIRIPLKKEFMQRIGGPNDLTSHYFICLIRHGTHVVFTQMVGTHDAMVRGSLDIPNLIKLSTIRENFRIVVEIYGMSITREAPSSQTPKKKKGMTPKKLLKGRVGHPLQSPGGPTAVRSTNFVEVASMTITSTSINRTHFNLERVPFNSPLQGTIYMRLHCLMESKVELAGFLTMFEDVSGFGAWHRRWCAIRGHHLSFWKYPDDETIKEPIGRIDLKQCITDIVGLIPRDVCARPNTFELLTVRRQTKGDSETLVTRCYNTMTTTKHWISCDQKDERVLWCDRLNEALHNIRTWHTDALRPVKQKEMVKPYNPYGEPV